MKKIAISLFILSLISAHAMTFAQAREGKIVFTKSELTRDGFREIILKGIFSERIWWTFYRRSICTINPDGTEFKQLTDGDTDYRPQWSPDGKKIAFYSGTPQKLSLHVMNPDGSNRIALVNDLYDIHDFKWSPDGKKILVYVKTESSKQPDETWVVTVAEEPSVERLGLRKWDRGWYHWASEGAVVLEPDRRFVDALPKQVEWPEWSPDRRYLAFMYNSKISMADTEVVGKPDRWRQGVFDPPCNRLIEWSPDGRKFLFLGGDYVSSINFDGSRITNLSMSKATFACWSLDGEYVAYTATDGRKENTEIFVMKADGTQHVQLTNSNYFHMDVDWR